jgi:polar amino acid transport system permease protein
MLSIFKPAQSYQRNFLTLESAKFLVAVGLLTWLMVKGSGNLSYNWQWYRIPGYLFTFADGKFVTGPLLDGLKVTFQITIISLLFSSIFGLATALFRLSDSLIARILARGYLELIRNTPLLVQLLSGTYQKYAPSCAAFFYLLRNFTRIWNKSICFSSTDLKPF